MRFTKKRLKRIMMEIQELLGVLSIEELIANNKITQRYQELQIAFLRTC